MATVDKLIVRIEADLKDLKRGLKASERATKNTTTKMKTAFAGIRGSVSRVSGAIFSLKGALVGLGVGAGIKSLINVGNEVESLQIRFKTLFGSAEEGEKPSILWQNLQVKFHLVCNKYKQVLEVY